MLREEFEGDPKHRIETFLDHHNSVMRKRNNKKTKSIEERLGDCQKYHRELLAFKRSIRVDRPNQPRDPTQGRFAKSDQYATDETSVALIMNEDYTYEEKGESKCTSASLRVLLINANARPCSHFGERANNIFRQSQYFL